MEQKKAELEVMPPIDFWTAQDDDSDEDDKCDEHKDLCVTIEVPFDPSDEDADAHSAKIKCFKSGTPEECCAHRVAVHETATKLRCFQVQKDGKGDVLDENGDPMTAEEVQDSEATLLIPLAKSSLRGHVSRLFEK